MPYGWGVGDPGRVTTRVFDLLAERGMTHAEFAERAGISAAHVSRIHTGAEKIGMAFIVGACEALGMPMRELFDYEPTTSGDEGR